MRPFSPRPGLSAGLSGLGDRSVLDQVQLWGEKLEEARYDVIDRLKRLTVSGGLIAEIAAVEVTTSALSSLLSATPDDPAYIFLIEY